jgi:CHAT domain-containing protein
LFRSLGDKAGEATTLSNEMHVWELKNPALAIFYGKRSVNIHQQLRSNIQGIKKQTQQTYLRTVEQTYCGLAEVLIRQGRLPEALQILNSFKDQQFFDLDKTQIKSPSPVSLTQRETEFNVRYQQTSENLSTVDTKVNGFTDLLKQANAEFSNAANEKDRVGSLNDLTEMQAVLRQLSQVSGQKAVAIYQLVGVKEFHSILISPDSICSTSTPITGDALNEKAKQFWKLLQSDRYDTKPASKEIYDIVFKPIEAKLPNQTTTIMWSLDGDLRYVPMAALWSGKEFLVERYGQVVFTRADRERMTDAVSSVWTGAGFGSSRAATAEVLGQKVHFSALPGVIEELGSVFRDPKEGGIAGTVITDTQFDRASFIDTIKQHPTLVHIASHFSFRPGDEARSFLLMGDGTAFTLEQMSKETSMFKGVELITLSACNTAAQQPDATGREIDGFAELAQRLGAQAVMATLWSVSDASTPELMRDFYSTRQSGGGTTKADALRRAQLALLYGVAEARSFPTNKRSEPLDIEGAQVKAPLFVRDPTKPFSHPYFWAPFVLIGNGR